MHSGMGSGLTAPAPLWSQARKHVRTWAHTWALCQRSRQGQEEGGAGIKRAGTRFPVIMGTEISEVMSSRGGAKW